ncbi:MFS transporter [Streptosporangium lutulentum]
MSGTDQIDERASGATSEPLRRNRDFVLLWSANVGSVLGANISSLAYPLIALDLTGSAVQAGLIGSATLITHIVFRLPAGALVDRWNRRRTMLACDLLRAGLLLAVVASLLSGRLTFWMLLGAAVISGTCAVFFHPAQMSALRRIVPTGRLPQAFALNEARDQVATIAGPPWAVCSTASDRRFRSRGSFWPTSVPSSPYWRSGLRWTSRSGRRSAEACSRTSSRAFDGPGPSGCCE